MIRQDERNPGEAQANNRHFSVNVNFLQFAKDKNRRWNRSEHGAPVGLRLVSKQRDVHALTCVVLPCAGADKTTCGSSLMSQRLWDWGEVVGASRGTHTGL